MANELLQDYATGYTLYALLFNASNQVYNGSAFEAIADANWANYDIAMTEAGTASGLYLGTMPSVTAGIYSFTVRRRVGGSPAVSDPQVGNGVIHWNGTTEVSLVTIINQLSIATSAAAAYSGGTINVYRGVTWTIAITSLGSLSNYDTIYFSAKENENDVENEALVRVKNDASGLERFNGAAPTASTNGTITVNDASAGNITVTVNEAETQNAPIVSEYYYDVKGVDDDGDVVMLAKGSKKFNVLGDVTRAIT